jgi:glutamate-5-semialdehyde dehydrogenase
MTRPDAATAVTASGQAAKDAAPHLAAAPDDAVDAALRGMARLLGEAAPAILAANAADVAAGEAGGLGRPR